MMELSDKEEQLDGFEPSKLGTRDYWDLSYTRELESFNELGDEGEVWFGTDSSDEILDWIVKFKPPGSSVSTNHHDNSSKADKTHEDRDPQILDVGCGNGQLLFLLVQGGYPINSLTGIDYSVGSIELASQIAKSKGIDNLRLEVKDILKDELRRPNHDSNIGEILQGWDLITDKGTFDAICLSDQKIDDVKLSEHYPQKVYSHLIKPGGIFLITSCNWTEEELIFKFVTKPNIGFKFHSEIPRSCFTFGGQKGKTITTIAFETTT